MLEINGKVYCIWRGDELVYPGHTSCAPMLKNTTSDLRVFYGWFFERPESRHDTFVWWANESYLTVTVDYTQSGTSPEVDECKTYGGPQSELVCQLT
ncbi:unnamed protein product [Taenia asiatica]|uniref:DUF5727 domain-containing protein n=1 Tax=Taenia asiatica TaxID=60517 RepID=A0A0R3WGE0_TAEAS|nr:unnamed protein product [Taenia asiatica]